MLEQLRTGELTVLRHVPDERDRDSGHLREGDEIRATPAQLRDRAGRRVEVGELNLPVATSSGLVQINGPITPVGSPNGIVEINGFALIHFTQASGLHTAWIDVDDLQGAVARVQGQVAQHLAQTERTVVVVCYRVTVNLVHFEGRVVRVEDQVAADAPQAQLAVVSVDAGLLHDLVELEA